MLPLSSNSIRILAFGASITAGWTDFGQRFTPYSTQLKVQLERAMPTANIQVDVDGFSGDTAIDGQYLTRLHERTDNAKIPYDWVVVQGGGNDLGSNREPAEIFKALKNVWSIPLEANWKVLALTVTRTVDSPKVITQRRATLNKLVLEHQAKGLFTLDMYSVITEDDLDVDGVHLSPNGYAKMGNAIAKWMIDHQASDIQACQ